MKLNKKESGFLAESLAEKFLKRRGYQILEKNFFFKEENLLRGEIDLIAKKEGVIHFIEVKSLFKETKSFFPENKFNFKKRKKIIGSAQEWLAKNNLSLETDWQVDLISVILDLKNKKAKINFFENV
jgi:putative endonuclease